MTRRRRRASLAGEGVGLPIHGGTMSSTTSVTISAPTLAPEFTFTASLKPPLEFGAGPFGARIYFEVTGGRAEGERFNADVLPGGGDWLLVGPDGLARLDVRAQFRTDDGALVYAQYPGVLELTDAVANALATGGSTAVEDQYFRTTPRFETGEERYAWLQQSVFVAVGRMSNGGVEYRVFRVA
jgi:hypothetical protein